MRKLATSIALIFYLGGVSHASLSMHFCCGKLIDFCWNGDAEKCGHAEEGKKKCCKDVTIAFECADEHAAAKWTVADFSPVNIMLVLPTVQWAVQQNQLPKDEVVVRSHAPPGKVRPKIFLLNRVIRW